jgi:Cu/Ag efflux pump CusA
VVKHREGQSVRLSQVARRIIGLSLSARGVKAQVAIKLYGDDLDVLRREAQKMQAAIQGVPGVRDLQVEQQVNIPQLRIEADGYKLEPFGLRRLDVNDFIETAMQGEVISEVLDGQRTFDLLVRLDEKYREDLDALKRMVIEVPSGGNVKLEDVARIYRAAGPNTINREPVRRRIIIQSNVSGRGLVDVVKEIEERIQPNQARIANRLIVGGLISSTLLDFFVRPALFWTMGIAAARRVVESTEQRLELADVRAEETFVGAS